MRAQGPDLLEWDRRSLWERTCVILGLLAMEASADPAGVIQAKSESKPRKFWGWVTGFKLPQASLHAKVRAQNQTVSVLIPLLTRPWSTPPTVGTGQQIAVPS